jgi:hypothetical protein
VSQVQGRAFEQLVGPDQPLTNWTASQAASLTSSVVQTSHRLAELDLFSDASLAAVLDRLPRQRLQVFTMGTDPNRPADWTPVEVGDASGADILAAVREGRLFVNARLIGWIGDMNDAADDEPAADSPAFAMLLQGV